MTALIPSAALLLSASVFLRPSPLTLLIRVALHCQAIALWVRRYAIPAVWRERQQYRYCFDEARRRISETPASKPVESPEPQAWLERRVA